MVQDLSGETPPWRLRDPGTHTIWWSSSGHALAWATEEEVWTRALGAAEPSLAFELPPEQQDLRVRGFAWARDGRSLYVTADDTLWLAPLEGSPPRLLWRSPSKELLANPKVDALGRVVFTALAPRER